MIAIGSDHGGFEMKEAVKDYLVKKGYEVNDCGTYSMDSCDYPQFGKAVAKMVADKKAEKGIVICTTGIGISMAANKVKGVRCALCSEPLGAKMTRLHNDANVLAMGGKMIGINLAYEIVDTFLNTPFSAEEKHSRRIAQIEE
ncbi:MAG: ribose 5-phosphate isomerase B [Lachnospiraceae bacterium]|nr:ribose 5-phosphate isomerase B [Lachnospiraceae bacterium]